MNKMYLKQTNSKWWHLEHVRSVWALVSMLVILSPFCPSVHAANCNMVDQCKCEFDDGSGTVDLSPIGTQSGDPLIKDVFAADNFAYSFNPCYPFTEGTCVNAAACQFDSANVIYYNIGDSAKVTFAYDGLNVIGTYIADDNARTSTVTFTCDPNQDPPSTSVSGEVSPGIYGFTVTSKYACPSGGQQPTPTSPTDGPAIPSGSDGESGGISIGSVLTIVVFSVIIVYLIAGMTFNKLHRHNTGREVVPNVTLWVALPGLVKAGFTFTYNKIRGRSAYTGI